MADKDDPTFRGPPASRPGSGAPRDLSQAPDPLAELARIVSGAPEEPAVRPAVRSATTGRASGRDLARDLEAELLENLQASFDAIRGPVDADYPHDTTSDEPELPPEPEPPAYRPPAYQPPPARQFDAPPPRAAAPPPAWPRLPSLEENLGRPQAEPYADEPAETYPEPTDPYAAEAAEPGPASWDEPAAEGAESWSAAERDWEAAVDRFQGDADPADDEPADLPEPLFPSAADLDPSFATEDFDDADQADDLAAAADQPEEQPYVRTARAAPLGDRWGYVPPLPADEPLAEEPDGDETFLDPATVRADDPYGLGQAIDVGWDENPVETSFELQRDDRFFDDGERPLPADDTPSEEQAEFEDFLNFERESDRLADYGAPDGTDYRSDAPDVFDADDNDDYAAVSPVVPPAAAYARRGERAAGGRRGGPSRRNLKIIGAMLGIVVVGGGAAVALFGSSGESEVLPPVIAANNDPFKVEAPQPQTPEREVGKLSYDRIISADQQNGRLPGSSGEAVMDVPPPPAPSEGSREISRIILPDGGGTPSPSEPTATEQEPQADDLAIQPRRVRTVVVKPDGTIITNDAGASEPSPEPSAPPAVAAAPSPAEPDANAPLQLSPPATPALPEAEPVQPPSVPRISAGESAPAPRPASPFDTPSGPAPASPQVAAVEPPAAPPPVVVPPIPTARPATGNTTVAIRRPDPVPSVPFGPIVSGPAPRPVQTAPVRPAPSPATASIGSGDFVVQVSSQRSEEAALSTYRSLQQRFPSLLGSFQPAIQRADLGEKGVYYRVRVGPMASREEAVAFCEQFRAAGGDCIVARF